MVRSNTNEWTLSKDQFAFLRQDEPEESIEAFLDEQIRRRFGEYVTSAVLPEYKGRKVLPANKTLKRGRSSYGRR
jgi:hypothetical protein